MYFTTQSGTTVPVLQFGTARMDTDDERRKVISTALDAGYRHLDTAQMYGSESAVGDAVRDADLDREEVFITTKLSGDNRTHDEVIDSTRDSLGRLETDYIDLLLIHFPNEDVSHRETLEAMNELVAEGAVKHIGVSNFSIAQTRDAIDYSDAPIRTNQVEYNINERKDDLLSFCIDENIVLTAYSPIGGGDVLDNETLGEIAERYNKTAAQIAIRWLLQQPMVSPISMSSKPDRIRRNFDVFDFELSGGEMKALFENNKTPDTSLLSKLDL
ncbi:aldo/keto reductase [Haladaptatus sp. CMAA 1911]|uniref:aldo/keto reductase n=1 Tax=unclassified Haladaptatus TaxID=2622732 RepID=UPI0037542D3F